MSAVRPKEVFYLEIPDEIYPLQMTRSCFRNPDKVKVDSWVTLNDIAPARRAWVLERLGGDTKVKMKVIQIAQQFLGSVKKPDPDSATATPEPSMSSQETPEEKCRSLSSRE